MMAKRAADEKLAKMSSECASSEPSKDRYEKEIRDLKDQLKGQNSRFDESIVSQQSGKRPAKRLSETECSPNKRSKKNRKSRHFEVERLLDHKVKNDERYFQIRWKGYDADADTWEPESYLSCPSILKEYKREHNLL